MRVKLAGIERHSVVDGPGIRTVVFAQGCPHRCAGCHNPQTIDREGGTWWELDAILAEVCDKSINGITFSGGEPFLQAEAFSRLAARIREKGLSIVTYTGYTYEELEDMALTDPHIAALLAATDLLVDGPYRQAERDLSLAFRGSGNQRVIDLMKTREVGEVVLSPVHFR